MWQAEVTRKTSATPQKIWKLWSDVTNWNLWDNEIEYSNLTGPFKTGSKGILKPKGGPKTKFELTEVRENQSFIDKSDLPLCSLYFTHTIVDKGNFREITHKVQFTGPLSFLFSRIIGKNIAKTLPHAVESLISCSEKSD